MRSETKICSNPKCSLTGVEQPLSAFYRRSNRPGPVAVCIACKLADPRIKEMKRAWHEREKAKREKNEALAAAFREKRNKQKRDRLKQESAEARALRLERERFGYRKRVGVTRIATRAPGSSERVDAEPLRELLLSRFEHASDAALVTGLAQDTVRLVMNGIKAAVSIDTADQACLKLDVLLEDLYPYEENEAA